jgi:hypothetical protein
MRLTMDKTIIIEVWRGIVSEVKNIPPGYDYLVVDLDEPFELRCPDETRPKITP